MLTRKLIRIPHHNHVILDYITVMNMYEISVMHYNESIPMSIVHSTVSNVSL